MDRKQLVKLVKREATNLKEHITKVERDQLDFNNLNFGRIDKCVYGLMTGNCFCKRATELIERCAPRVYSKDPKDDSFEKSTLNGKPTESKRSKYWSPIECYIAQAGGENNRKLLKFIKGETDILEIE